MKSKRINIILLVIVALLVIPQTRKSIQVLLHKGVALISYVDIIEKKERIKIENFDWQLLDENGVTINFEALKGQVVIINFWATWCPPCLAEMPSLQKLYKKYENKAKFLFVTNDFLDEKLINFKQKKSYTFPVYQIVSKPPNELMTTSIPRTLLINTNGEIVVDKFGAANWFDTNIQNTIENLLK